MDAVGRVASGCLSGAWLRFAEGRYAAGGAGVSSATLRDGALVACCNEHSRSDLLRRGLAEAGRGLPAIEPGMPMPAGTGLDRRTFVARGVGLALAVYGGSALRPQVFDEGIAAASAAGPEQKVLVSVFLDGGADALSLLAPTGDPLYRQLRPRLALPAGAGPAFGEDPTLTWHPSLAPLAQLHGEGKVSVMRVSGATKRRRSS